MHPCTASAPPSDSKESTIKHNFLHFCTQVSDEDVAAIEELGRQGGLFERLAASIAPEIYGMLEVKKVRKTAYILLSYRNAACCVVSALYLECCSGLERRSTACCR
jgi:hypothetical protein